MTAKAALVAAFGRTSVSRRAFARCLGVDDGAFGQMIDPRHATATNRLHKALRELGCELVVESNSA